MGSLFPLLSLGLQPQSGLSASSVSLPTFSTCSLAYRTSFSSAHMFASPFFPHILHSVAAHFRTTLILRLVSSVRPYMFLLRVRSGDGLFGQHHTCLSQHRHLPNFHRGNISFLENESISCIYRCRSHHKLYLSVNNDTLSSGIQTKSLTTTSYATNIIRKYPNRTRC